MATVTTQAQFRSALAAGDPEIILANNITLSLYSTISYAVTIKGVTPGTSLFWGSPSAGYPNMLVVSSTGTLTLESITLDAQNRDGTLVQINGGTLIINEDTVLQNITTTSARNAVSIASNSSTVGGTLIMNSGKITGVDGEFAVFCAGGSVIMNNNAEISGNTSTGIGVTQPQNGARGTLTMTGNARIWGNRPELQIVGGVVILSSDMYMGTDEGDAPEVYDNRRVAGGFAGGIILTSDSTLTMCCDSKVRGNYSDYLGGGITAQDSVITMRDKASVTENICESEYGGGGLRLLRDAQLVIEGEAHISNNTSTSYGGGIFMQAGAHLEMKGDSSIFGNEAANGGGIFADSSTSTLISSLLIGTDDSRPQIHENTAGEDGGGINIRSQTSLNLSGFSCIQGNNGQRGKGIYKEGILHISQSAQVGDGLFFEDTSIAAASSYYRSSTTVDIRIDVESQEDSSHIELKAIKQVRNSERSGRTLKALSLQDPKHTDNVPVIFGQLTKMAEIQLEVSEYVSTPNIPLVIADKGSECPLLDENERAAWNIPQEFGTEYKVILNEEFNQVLIVHEIYNISYCHLYGADNPNPESYSRDSEFPILLQEPGERNGYLFEGWYNCEGQPVTEIAEGTTGDALLIALWKENPTYSIKYCHLYGADNPNPDYYSAYSEFPIILQEPEERCGYEFVGWYDCAGQHITQITECTKGDIMLIALWQKKTKQKFCLIFEGNASCVSNVPDPIHAYSGELVTIPFDKPKRYHYYFVSWNTCSNGTGISYSPGDKLRIRDKNITLYALWMPDYCEKYV